MPDPMVEPLEAGEHATVDLETDLESLTGYTDPAAVSEAVRPYVAYNNRRVAVEHALQEFRESAERMETLVETLTDAAESDTAPPPDVIDQYLDVRPVYEQRLERIAHHVEALEGIPKDSFEGEIRDAANQFEYMLETWLKHRARAIEAIDRVIHVEGDELTLDGESLRANTREILETFEAIQAREADLESATARMNGTYAVRVSTVIRADNGLLPFWWLPTLTGPADNGGLFSLAQVGTWVALVAAVGYALTAGPLWLAVLAPVVFLLVHNVTPITVRLLALYWRTRV